MGLRQQSVRRVPVAGVTLAALSVLLSVLTTGCNGALPGVPGAGSGGPDLLSFLSPRRTRPKDFGESLDNMAPVGPGTAIYEPFAFVERRAGPGSRSTSHILWPLISVTRSREERSFVLRPIVAVESRPGEKRVEALWPIFSYYREGENKTLYIRPLFSFKRRVRTGGTGREVDTDWFLLPLLFGGNDTREGPYFAIFPLFGTLKGQLGKEKISFFAFPLWMAARDKRYESFHFMWPVMGYWKGPDQHGRRLWPFFGVNRREGRFDRRFWFWPFFTRWKAGLDTVYPGDGVFFFPFYGRIKSMNVRDPDNPKPHLDWRTWMWPLYSIRRYAPRNVTEAHLPWPVFGYERADGLVVRKLWPIWGVRKSNDRRDKFVLWPLYRRTLVHLGTHEERWHSVALFFTTRLERWVEDGKGGTFPPPWPGDFGVIPDPRIEAGQPVTGDALRRRAPLNSAGLQNGPNAGREVRPPADGGRLPSGTHKPHKPYRTLAGEVRSRRYTQLWPLFQYERNGRNRRNERGEMRLQMLSLLPQRSAGRSETLLGPFLSFYRYEHDRTRQQRESFLFGLIRHFRRNENPGPGMRYVNIGGIVSYHRRSGVGKRFSILGGLIGYERVGGRRAWKFLWVWFGRIPRAVREEYEARYAAGLESR